VTQSTELRFPLPVSHDLGLSGRAFVDVGTLSQANFINPTLCRQATGAPCVIVGSGGLRMGVGIGVSWATQFGLLNVDLTPFVIKQSFDQTQVFRFGFGTRF
jgi:outer membrane protein insertion porin family